MIIYRNKVHKSLDNVKKYILIHIGFYVCIVWDLRSI